jgi:hypothetical protein
MHYIVSPTYHHFIKDFPKFTDSHINVLELKTVLESARRWGHLWGGLHIRVLSDNSATVAAINKGTSRSSDLMPLVQDLFWLSVSGNFKLSANFIPGVDNILADRISRMDSYSEACEARIMLANFTPAVVYCASHMSPTAFLSLQDAWRRG